MERISWEYFERVDMRVGTVIFAEIFEKAHKKAYILKIDFGGELGVLKSSAQITDRYDVASLMGKQVVAIVNFPKKQIANIQSECLVLGALSPNGVSLIVPEHDLANGSKIS